MACALRRYGVTDSGKNCRNKQDIQNQLTAYSKQSLLGQVYWDKFIGTSLLGQVYWDKFIGTSLLGQAFLYGVFEWLSY
ncbi:MAG: hypothetical protein P8X89_21970 [Reinekea sp.]